MSYEEIAQQVKDLLNGGDHLVIVDRGDGQSTVFGSMTGGRAGSFFPLLDTLSGVLDEEFPTIAGFIQQAYGLENAEILLGIVHAAVETTIERCNKAKTEQLAKIVAKSAEQN